MSGETRIDLIPARNRDSAPWHLVIDAQHAKLLDPDGVLITVIPHATAARSITLPNRPESGEHVILTTSEGKALEFEADPSVTTALKRFQTHSEIAGGTEAVDSLRRSAFRNLLVGGVAILAGAGLSARSYFESAGRGGSAYLFLGLVLYGLILVGKGAIAHVRANRLSNAMDSRAGIPAE